MPPRGRRPVGGPDTREAILTAARELFAEVGFERATMRAVAARADVDPALIHHYFGTKDRLLSAALDLPLDPREVFAGVADDPSRTGEELVRRLLGVWEDDPATRAKLVGMLRIGLSHEHTASLLREVLGRTVLAAVQEHAASDDAPLRAALVGTQVGGLLMGRYLLRVPAVADAPVEQLVAAVGPTLQRYLSEPLR